MYLRVRKEWRVLCKEKEKEEKKNEEVELNNLNNNGEVWKYLNKIKKMRGNRDSNLKAVN